ncbi:MAG: alkaline phosphatase family protein, partial [Planctomycetota bacterium]
MSWRTCRREEPPAAEALGRGKSVSAIVATAGHTTLATGAHPADHGMVANVWLDRSTGELAAGEPRGGGQPVSSRPHKAS